MASRRGRGSGTGPSGAVVFGLMALLTALFVVTAWGSLREEQPQGALASAPPTAIDSGPTPPTSGTAPAAAPGSPTSAVVVVERRPPTLTPRPSPTGTAAPPTMSPTSAPPTATPTASATQPPATATATVTPSSTEAPTETPQPATATPAPLVHVVQSGESFFVLGQKYGTSVEAIAAANGLPTDAVLQLGQELVIPRPLQ